MPDPSADVLTVTPQRGAPVIASDRGFAAKGDPGGPGACLWCGDKLRGVGPAIRKAHPNLVEARGDYADNAFCGLRCGYAFGLQMVLFGRRLQVTKPVSAFKYSTGAPTKAMLEVLARMDDAPSHELERRRGNLSGAAQGYWNEYWTLPEQPAAATWYVQGHTVAGLATRGLITLTHTRKGSASRYVLSAIGRKLIRDARRAVVRAAVKEHRELSNVG